MDLTINPTRVNSIRVGDTWTDITSLTLGTLAYQGPGFATYPIGPGYQATTTDGDTIAGPLTAITAVNLRDELTTTQTDATITAAVEA